MTATKPGYRIFLFYHYVSTIASDPFQVNSMISTAITENAMCQKKNVESF